MEEIEIREDGVSQFTMKAFVGEVKANAVLLSVIIIICAVFGGIFGRFFVKTTYVSEAALVVSTMDETGDVTMSKELATEMKAFLDSTSNMIFQNVETEYNSLHRGQKITAKELAQSLKIDLNAVMIDLKFTSSNKDAKIILQIIIENMLATVNDNKAGNYTYEEFANKLKEASPASDAVNDEKSKTFKYMVIFFAVGVLGSLLFVFLKIVLNDTYFDKEMCETDLGVDVLAMIEYVAPSKKTKEGK